MDGVLARANCLLITTLWTVFKFVMVPLGARLASLYPPSEFAVVFALIWGSYTDHRHRRRGRRVAVRQADAARLGHRRHQPQVDRRHRLRVRRGARVLPGDCRRPRPAAALGWPGPRDRGVEHRPGAVLAARDGRRHYGDRERAALLGIRRARRDPRGFAPRTPLQRRSLAASPLAPLRWLARAARSRVATA